MGRDVEENQEMMNTLISIIIPVYQAEETIERCLHSIVEQTYSNLEIILIDDGSTDKVEKYVIYGLKRLPNSSDSSKESGRIRGAKSRT